MKVGDESTASSILLNDVCHVSGLKKNLISVSQITNSEKYVLLGPNDVKVLDKVKNIEVEVVLAGQRKSLCS